MTIQPDSTTPSPGPLGGSEPPSPPSGALHERGRKRSEQSRMAILKAARELAETTTNYRSFSVEAIAKRAGVGKATIYRWWSSKFDLLVELNSPSLPSPQNNSLLEDLKELIRAEAELQRTGVTRAVYSGGVAKIIAMDEARGEDEPSPVMEHCQQKTEELARLFERAKERGDWWGPLDIELAFEAYYGAIYYRTIVRGLSIDDALLERYARQVMEAAKPLAPR